MHFPHRQDAGWNEKTSGQRMDKSRRFGPAMVSAGTWARDQPTGRNVDTFIHL